VQQLLPRCPTPRGRRRPPPELGGARRRRPPSRGAPSYCRQRAIVLRVRPRGGLPSRRPRWREEGRVAPMEEGWAPRRDRGGEERGGCRRPGSTPTLAREGGEDRICAAVGSRRGGAPHLQLCRREGTGGRSSKRGCRRRQGRRWSRVGGGSSPSPFTRAQRCGAQQLRLRRRRARAPTPKVRLWQLGCTRLRGKDMDDAPGGGERERDAPGS
jgi:hypothetical protein